MEPSTRCQGSSISSRNPAAGTWLWAGLLVTLLASETTLSAALGSARKPFTIRIVDQETGRGVPLVELRTVNNIAWWSDSAGLVAFDEPGLLGQEVFFHVSSPGYEYPKDFFNNRGAKLRPVAGGRAELKLQRLNIAERLYRITGAGLYRDSLLAGRRVPVKQPGLNAQVMGQDTVIATPYRGRIYWFWGDTDLPGYPLGNFGASGATSLPPGRGGLDPGVGVDLTYFTNAGGASKPMCPLPGQGLRWIEGLLTVPDERGVERLVARVANQRDLGYTHDWHLMIFNDAKQEFESMRRWEIRDGHDSAHPFRAQVDGVNYFYLYPNFRVRADLTALQELTNYQAFTCVGGDGRWKDSDTAVDRDGAGRVRYFWKPGADRLHAGRLKQLLASGKLDPGESWLQLQDLDSGAPVEAGRGSVFWNDYRQRWVMIAQGKPGEVWFSEADTPVGPWVYARRIAVHGRYNFYNPTQHPFFDAEGGRVIYFEGTYTASFSAAPVKTPRYDYNQLMYRLSLADPRLTLPQPVYRVRRASGPPRHLMREGIVAERVWDQIEGIAFFAIPPSHRSKEFLAVSPAPDGAHWLAGSLASTRPPLFLALPAPTAAAPSVNALLPDFEPADGKSPQALIWKNPVRALPLDFQAQAQSAR